MRSSSFAAAAAQSKPAAVRFVEIDHHAPAALIEQLVNHDSVHFKGAENADELRECRLGGPMHDGTCYAMVEGDRVHCAIYVKKFYAPVSSDADLCGDVAGILGSKVAPNIAMPTSLVFYSISNITGLPGMGQRLVVNLYKHLKEHYPNAILTTLSPCRTFDKNFTAEDTARFTSLSEREKAKEVVEYLLTGRDKGVQGFHMGNGATPADVNFNAGDIERDKETGVLRFPLAMINYRYDGDSAVIAKRAEAYAEIRKILRNDKMDAGEREKVREMMLPLIGRELLQKAGMMTAELEKKVAPFESQNVIVVAISAGQQHLRM